MNADVDANDLLNEDILGSSMEAVNKILTGNIPLAMCLSSPC
jgi:hypothetical protein